jgi:mannose-6-phosphate isomerase-like protein (cupin superfamily)
VTETGTVVEGFGLARDGGERLSWMGDPTVLKVTGAATDGAYALAEIVSTPEGFVPLHVHHREDEAFYVLEGEVTFTVGDGIIEAGPGSFAFGPRDVPHRYEITSPSARMLMLFSPAGFEGFIRETSEPTDSLEATVPQDLDLEMIAEIAARYGAEMLG